MWGALEEPPDAIEGAVGPLQDTQTWPANAKEICKDNENQLKTFKDIMLKNKNDLKRKEEELQEYASKLSEIKSRAKLSRRSKDGGSSSVEMTPESRAESSLPEGDAADDIRQAKTPKAKSSLLQRKLAENRKVFEKRSKEMTASKRAVEEKVEAIRQQMDQTDMTIVEAQRDSLTVTPVRPVVVTQIVPSPALQLGHLRDKDNKIAELGNRIMELEATVIDLQDNLKEKDSVIESKTRAVTLLSADLSKKGKTTLDTLEDTKDEMRTMQENFVLLETSLKGKNENLLEQLQKRNDKVTELETTIDRSRSTMDTLADTKDAMRSMQENFVLIETSLKDKIDNLLKQLQEYETKLAEAQEKIYKFESDAGIVTAPEIPDLRYKIDRLEQNNRALRDEKYELQKSIAELQEKIVTRELSKGNSLILEKDNRIAELENLIKELKNSNKLLEEESKAELVKQVSELTTRNEKFRSEINGLEELNNDLKIKMNELQAKIPEDSDATKEDATVNKLTKELDYLNKSMIKLKAQHKSKLKNLQKQLESFKMVSDANVELVKLGNQVALLEEEKGNLQLSLVDFDELKASAGDWQDRIADLESRVSTQTNDIQAHIEAIAILENQKLDLIQELHTAKQEISALEAENAESENLRVTAEMKVVDLEEQLESLHKSHNENESSKPEAESVRQEFLNKIEHPMHENSELVQKVAKLEEKPSSEAGSTESFETIHEDRNEMLRKIAMLSSRNNQLEEKLTKLEEEARSNVGSTESFETINDTDKSELIKKIDLLSRENSDLLTKLNKFEEKGSSDTGSTESFEKIPEHGESLSRIEVLTRENNELVIKLTKIEEKYNNLENRQFEASQESTYETSKMEQKLENLIRENSDLVIELTKVQEQLSRVSDEKKSFEQRLKDSVTLNVASDEVAQAEVRTEELKSRIDSLTTENNKLIIKLVKLEEKNNQLNENLQKFAETKANNEKVGESVVPSTVSVISLESEIEECRKLIAEQTELIEEMKIKVAEKEAELEEKIQRIREYEVAGISVEESQRQLRESFGVIEEWKFKCTEMERKMEILEAGKMSIEEGLEILQQENKVLIERSRQKDEAMEALKQELDNTITKFETRLEAEHDFIAKQEQELTSLQEIVKSKEQKLHDKNLLLSNEMIKIDTLRDALNTSKTQLGHNETTIVSLNEEIARLNGVLGSSKEETLSARAEIIVLREELQLKVVKEAKNEELRRLLSDRESLAEEMKALLNEQLKENAELRNAIENTNAEVIKLRAVLAEKENEVASLETVKSTLEENLRELATATAEAEGQLELLQNNLDDNNKYSDDLKSELNDAYRMLELLKTKHTEDVEMQNRRLENVIEDLNGKNSECEIMRTELEEKAKFIEDLERRLSGFEILRAELAEKEKIIGENVTEQTKIALELRVKELERKLEESEANAQVQLKKRKILAANLKKKSSEVAEHEAKAAQVKAKAAMFETKFAELEPKIAEYEAKAAELEEKWILEKSEKEAANLRIQEIQSIVEHRDHTILQLEDQLRKAEREAASAIERVEELSRELRDSTEKINAIMEQVFELGEEVEKLRTEVEQKSSQIESERNEKTRIIVEYDSCRRKIVDEEIQRQQVLEEAKEKARELGVRMQVMETEYVDQLNTIQTLRTENGMLVSKQAQISERLENAEKEAAERKILLDELQREIASRETGNIQRREPSSSEDHRADLEVKASSSQPCDHCDQCQTVVQALEAKLQERDAEIENLDNELANSIGNFVHMRESLRVSDLMNQSSSRNRSLEDARDNSDLVFQYNALTASNTEIRDQLNATIQENRELKDKIASLQALNGALEERTSAVEEELIEGRETTTTTTTTTTRLHAVDALHTELMEKCELGEKELRDARSELEVMKQWHEETIAGMRSQVEQLKSKNRELTSKCDELVRKNDSSEGEIGSLREQVDRWEGKVSELEREVEKYKEENIELLAEASKPVEKTASSASAFFEQKNDSPQLFDAAKVFGLSTGSDSTGQKEITDLRNIVAIKDSENIRLSEEVRRLEEQLLSQQSQGEETNANCRRLRNELTHLEQLFLERNRQIDVLNSELNNVGVQLAAQLDQQGNIDSLESAIAKLSTEFEERSKRLADREVAVENLTAANAELAAQLKNFQRENYEYSSAIDVVSSAVKNLRELEADKVSEIADDEFLPVAKEKISEILCSLAALKQERIELLAHSQETHGQKNWTLEIDAESSNDATRVQELEERVDRMTRERDIKQLQVNDLTRSLEEMQESVESASSHEESRLRNLQAALDEALNEHDRLRIELEAMRQEREGNGKEEAEPAATTVEAGITQSAQSLRSSMAQTPSITDVESGWDDEAKLDIDEETRSWNPEDARLAASDNLLAAAPLQPGAEVTLKMRIAELEEKIKDSENEREKLTTEVKTAEVRSSKLVKKLKEFKIRNESLQKQLNIQKALSGFGDLDSAIEEELKSRIASLEISLSESKEERKRIITERDNLSKKIDVLLAANERLVEMKERQDREVEAMQIRTKDLTNKLRAIESRFKEACGDEAEVRALFVDGERIDAHRTDSVGDAAAPRARESAANPAGFECLCKKYKEEMEELRDEMEALAAENERLQKLLEERESARQLSESTFAEKLAVREKEVEESMRRRDRLEKDLEDAREEYRNLRDRCDRSASNSNEQTCAIKRSHEMLKVEIAEKTNAFEAQMAETRGEVVAASSQINILQEQLETLVREKRELIERTKSYEETNEKVATMSEAMAEVTDLLNARVQEVAELKRQMRKLKNDENVVDTLATVASPAQNDEQYLHRCETRLTEMSNEIIALEEKLNESEVERASTVARLNEIIHENLALREKLAEADAERTTNTIYVQNLHEEIERFGDIPKESKLHRESLQSELAEKEQLALRKEEEMRKYSLETERLNRVVARMQKSSADSMDEANGKIREIEEREMSLKKTIAELMARESDILAQIYRETSEKDEKVAMLEGTISDLERKMHDFTSGGAKEEKIHDLPVRETMADGSEEPQRTTVEQLRAELSRKNEEIEDYKYQLSESTYPSIIQALQDRVNQLYEEKARVESDLNALMANIYGERAEIEKEFVESRLEKRRETNEPRRQLSESRSDETFVSMLNARDTEIRNLKMEIEEKGVRFGELHDNYESAEVEINELRIHLGSKEEEIRMLRMRLEATSKECELSQRAFKRELPSDTEALRKSELSPPASSSDATKERSSKELNLALYMLHQRDVRVEELTHELMQLLEERDTLQLRLSNAIRINEELRRSVSTDAAPSENPRGTGDVEPLVQQPSPSKSVGPVEIAKEAIDSPSEEKIALAQKLSQLRNMGHRRDVRLMDDRESRHNQQMSLLAHRDVLSALPPEAAANLVNANYTLSRDVQSQSSILMNWLWGKSTPKVVHM